MNRPIFVEFVEAETEEDVAVKVERILMVRETDEEDASAVFLIGENIPLIVNGTVGATMLKIRQAIKDS